MVLSRHKTGFFIFAIAIEKQYQWKLPINTTSKLGLPFNTLLRNQHGQTRRKRHNKKRKQHTRDESGTTTIENRMWSIQAAVAYLRARSVRTLRDPANHRARSFRTWKMHLVIEHNHQSFEQLGTSSRDIRSKFILSREAQSFRACGKDVCGQSSTTITSDRLSSSTPIFVVFSSQKLHPLPGPWKTGQ